MKRTLKTGTIIAVAAIAIAAAYYVLTTERSVAPPPLTPSALTSGVTTPTAEFLKSNPDALVDAQKRCDAGNGQDVVPLCDAVHSAKASLMADKFRQGPPGGAK